MASFFHFLLVAPVIAPPSTESGSTTAPFTEPEDDGVGAFVLSHVVMAGDGTGSNPGIGGYTLGHLLPAGIGEAFESTESGSTTTASTEPATEIALSIVSVDAVAHNTASATVTITKPAGLADGDLLLVGIGANDSVLGMSSAPSGWTLLDSKNSSTSGTFRTQGFIYYKLITSAAGEPSSYSWTLGASDSQTQHIIYQFEGALVPTVHANDKNSGAASLPFPSITTPADNCIVLGINSMNFAIPADVVTPATGFTLDKYVSNATGSAHTGMLAGEHKVFGLSGATGIFTASMPQTHNSSMFSIAIAPSAVPVTEVPTHMRVSAVSLEVLRVGFPAVRVSEMPVEVLRAPAAPVMRVSAVPVEVLWEPSSGLNFVGSDTDDSAIGTTTVTVNKPSGVSDGDLLLAYVTAPASGTISAPGGWTSVATSSATNVKSQLFKKTAASEGSTYAFGVGSGKVGTVHIVKADPSQAGDFGTVSTITSGNSTASTAHLVTGNPQALKPMGSWFSFVSAGNGVTYADPTVPGFALADRQKTAGTTAGTDVSSAFAKGRAYGGSAPDVTFTPDGSSTNCGISVSLVSSFDFG